MATNGEVIQRVQSLYNHGIQSDDSRLDDRLVYNNLVSVRNLLISQKRNKKQTISESSFQSILIEMEKVDVGSDFCLPNLGCQTWRSVNKVPLILKSSYGNLINYVGTVDGFKKFSLTTFNSMKYVSYSKFTKNNDKAYINGDYLYLTTNNDVLHYVLFKAVFSNPLDIESCVGTNNSYKVDEQNPDLGKICKSAYEKVFPIDGDLVETCISLTAEKLLNIFIKTFEINDEQNNAREKD